VFKFLATIFKLAFLCVVVVAGIVIYQMSEESDKKKESTLDLIERAKKDPNLAIHVSPAEISALYSKNEFAANQEYKGKLVSIKGEVKKLDTILSTPVIELWAGTNLLNMFDSIYMDFKGDREKVTAALSKIEPGQKVRLLCFGSGGVHFDCHTSSFY